MSKVVNCPKCSGQLRITDELFGWKVRCPACGETFQAPDAPAPEASAEWAVPAEEPELAADVLEEVPPRRRRRPAPPLPEEELPEVEATRRGGRRRERGGPQEDDFRRRDQAPHRGGMLQLLGIASVVLALLACLLLAVPWAFGNLFATRGYLVGFVLGPAAWLVGIGAGAGAWAMGASDLARIKDGSMDSGGESSTQAGYTCGIIGACANLFLMLSCGGILGLLTYQKW